MCPRLPIELCMLILLLSQYIRLWRSFQLKHVFIASHTKSLMAHNFVIMPPAYLLRSNTNTHTQMHIINSITLIWSSHRTLFFELMFLFELNVGICIVKRISYKIIGKTCPDCFSLLCIGTSNTTANIKVAKNTNTKTINKLLRNANESVNNDGRC